MATGASTKKVLEAEQTDESAESGATQDAGESSESVGEAKALSSTPLLLSFGLSFLVGIYFTNVDFYTPWSQTIVTALYSFHVFFHMRAKKVTLPEIILDSPYYLGFLLTLIAFSSMLASLNTSVTGLVIPSTLSKMSAALLTTIVGLFARYLIYNSTLSYVDNADSVEQLLQRLSINANKMLALHSGLLEMQDEYLTKRAAIYELEIQSIRNYMEEIKEIPRSLQNGVSSLVDSFQHATTELTESIRRDTSDIVKSYNKGTANLTSAVESNISKIEESVSHLSTVATELDSYLSSVSELVREKDVPTSFDGISSSANQASTSISAFSNSVESFQGLEIKIKSSLMQLNDIMEEFARLLTNKLNEDSRFAGK